MTQGEQEIFVRNAVVLFAAASVVVLLIIIYIKNAGLRIFPIGRRISDLQNTKSKVAMEDLLYEWDSHCRTEDFFITLDDGYAVWDINMFSMKMHHKEKLFLNLEGIPWFEFAKTKEGSEKIISPVLRKIIAKYKGKFEKVHPIRVVRTPSERTHLYTWLKNETHINLAIFNFLDEAVYLAKEAGVYPSLSVVWGEVIYVEVIFPRHGQLQDEITNLVGLDYDMDESLIKVKLWIAFSMEKVPEYLKNPVHREQSKKNLSQIA